jgi:hypothetical protein
LPHLTTPKGLSFGYANVSSCQWGLVVGTKLGTVISA